MLKRLFALLPCLLFLALVASLQLAPPPPAPSNLGPDGRPAFAPAPPQAEPSRKADDPTARLDYEQMRLHDPATGIIPRDIHRLEQEFAAELPDWDLGAHAEGIASRPKLAGKAPGWTYRGPYNIGGRTRALAIDVSDPSYQTLLAGGVSGGMWRSTNDGASWTLTTGSSQLHSVTCIAQDTRPGKENVWYYGTGELRGNSASLAGDSYRGDGIFKSTDGGQSWALLPSTSTGVPESFDQDFDYVSRVVIDPTSVAQDIVYAACYGGIYRSTDGGGSWALVLGSPTFRSRYSEVLISPTGVLYATLSSDGGVVGVFRSTDGIAWANITTPLLTSWGRIVPALAPSDENILYLLVADRNGTSAEGFYRYDYISGNGSGAGGSWVDRSANLNGLPDYFGSTHHDFEVYGSYCMVVCVKPDDPDTVFLGGVHLYRSTDGWATKNNVSWVGGWLYTNHHADQHWMLYQPGSTSIAYTGSDGGVHKSFNMNAGSVSWNPLNNGYNTSQYYTVAIDEAAPGSDYLVGGMQDNGSWWTNQVSPSASWVEQFGGDGSYCAIADHSGAVGTYYFSYQGGYVYRQEVDSSGNWLTWTRVDPTGGGSYLFINPYILDPNDTRMMYVSSSNGVWRNSNLLAIPDFVDASTSLNWTHITGEPAGEAITSLEMTRDGQRTLYYGTQLGRIYRVDDAHTTGAFTTPTNISAGKGLPTNAYVSCITSDPNDGDRLIAVFSNYNVPSLWLSEDGGASWTDIEGNLAGSSGPSVRWVAIVPYGGVNLYYLGTSIGLYSTVYLHGVDTYWRQEAPVLMGNVVVDMLATRPADGLVVAGTHGKGVYSLQIPVGTANPPVASTLRLEQNTPNPFNPSTSISFRLPTAGHVRLAVYDVAGRLVRVLADETLGEGPHVRSWDGTDAAGREVASGSYVYRLSTAQGDESRKMTLLK